MRIEFTDNGLPAVKTMLYVRRQLSRGESCDEVLLILIELTVSAS